MQHLNSNSPGILYSDPREVLPGDGRDEPAAAPAAPAGTSGPIACTRAAAGPPPLPFILFDAPDMELFDPRRHLPKGCKYVSHGAEPEEEEASLSGASLASLSGSFTVPDCELGASPGGFGAALTPLPLFQAARQNPDKTLIPREEDCHALWERYLTPAHIRVHSTLVAHMAHALVLRAGERGAAVHPEAALAAGLLHDLGKAYSIGHGGSHAQLGASWVMRETRNSPIARAVLFHVHWPWEPDVDDDRLFLAMCIIYADKRVKHTSYVTLEERFNDLLNRYGVSEYARSRIKVSHEQGKQIEAALSRRLGVNIHEYTADSGRLVKRT